MNRLNELHLQKTGKKKIYFDGKEYWEVTTNINPVTNLKNYAVINLNMQVIYSPFGLEEDAISYCKGMKRVDERIYLMRHTNDSSRND